ncbi:acetamidase/formamidase family protein [uncultured Clostridium sp.]|uniref:acetamidase/formamidase family protein n=1 Tax=uncultured Clostridium sp. TaxID=59620 RepID=UPI0027DB8333|nr:acetamidase/formamidase family protein [uncultured Clostridium sp.]
MLIIKNDSYVYKMSYDNKPVAYAASGEIIQFETNDCYGNQYVEEDQPRSTINITHINPATGPVYINYAKAGDTLKVEILDIKVNDHGVMRCTPGVGVYKDQITKARTKIIPIIENKAIFNDNIHIPIRPMIGVIGTACEEGTFTNTPGKHGGNMDCKKITKDSTLYLPVNVDGALLAMGDLHAIMGDGETVICGVEIQGLITIKVSILKSINLPLPFLVNDDKAITIFSAESLDSAASGACISMHKYLTDYVGMDPNDAGMLLSLQGDLSVCQVVNPLVTCRMELPLELLKNYNTYLP